MLWSVFLHEVYEVRRQYLKLIKIHKNLNIREHLNIERPVIEKTENSDLLYKRLNFEIRGHDPQVLESYEKFIRLVTQELQLQLLNVETPLHFTQKITLLRSKFAKKKYWRQYEIRTYNKKFYYQHLTGSTADTFLEYIQRNLPEGIMMNVERVRLEQFRENLVPPSSRNSSTPQLQNQSTTRD
ncbi:unnamed protein product [Didymodactylos carnosus]|uniref:Small ribosomal subunit protein uS10m n=1 Tax=Didymodactylos carnosus TaxID=1234261 RepID=A0A8S2ILW1_9BILA|nr:unnamed protein product [Didymodactylos carnosus]CAF3765033.1 unnamed protein product [Didymodactylos carnosus]